MAIAVKPTHGGYEYTETFYSLTGGTGFANKDFIFCFETINPNYVVLRAYILEVGGDDNITVASSFQVYQRGWDDRTIYSFGRIASGSNPRALENGLIEFNPIYDGEIDLMGDSSNTDPYTLGPVEQFFMNVRIATEICNDLMKKEADPSYSPKHNFQPIEVTSVYMAEGIYLSVS